MKCDNQKNTFQIGEEKAITAKPKSIAPTSQIPVNQATPIISLLVKKQKRRFRFSPKRLLLPLFCLFLAYLMLFSYVEKSLDSRITPLAQARARQHLLETVNETIGQMSDKGLLTYDSMVKTIRDEKGEVIYLEVDTGMLSRAKSTLVQEISRSLEENRRFYLSVPLGSLTGWNLFSGIGFPVGIKLFPLGMAEGEIYTVLEDCGINQTRHLIQIKIKVSLLIVLPEENIQVETEAVLPLGERVLVGEVPEIFLDTLGAG